MISKRRLLSPFLWHFQRSGAVVCGRSSVSKTNTATTSAGSERHATFLCRTRSKTIQTRNCSARLRAKKTERKVPMRPIPQHRQRCRTIHKDHMTCLPSVSALKPRGPQLLTLNKASALRARLLSGAEVPVSQTRPLLELSGKPATRCALHTHRTTSVNASLNLASPMRTLKGMTMMTTTMMTSKAATATMTLGDSNLEERGIMLHARDAIRVRKMVGETWKRQRIWWPEPVVETLKPSKRFGSRLISHNKSNYILDSVEMTPIDREAIPRTIAYDVQCVQSERPQPLKSPANSAQNDNLTVNEM